MLKQRSEKRIELARSLALLGCLFLALACGPPMIAPAAINPEDMCAQCRMAISEKQYAAQFITRDGEAFKFDDIGCMRDYLEKKQDRAQVAAHFVADYETREWLEARAAHYVRAEELATPMSGHIVAFGAPDRAQAAAGKYRGEALDFAAVFGR